jgi:alpha-L-fucosidase 2
MRLWGAVISLKARGDGGTGWSKAWKIGFWSRLYDGDHALLMLGQQLKESTFPNLWDSCPPFQIDGNFGAIAGIAEMLLQSHSGFIDILPALPRAWPNGQVRGLRARGDLTLDLQWKNGRVQTIAFVASHRMQVTMRSTAFASRFSLTEVVAKRAFPVAGSGPFRTFSMKECKRYLVTAF